MLAPLESVTVPVTSASPLNGPRSCSILRLSEPRPRRAGALDWLTTLLERGFEVNREIVRAVELAIWARAAHQIKSGQLSRFQYAGSKRSGVFQESRNVGSWVES